MRPKGIRGCAFRLAVAGIEYIYIVYPSVSVTVVFREVNLVVEHLAGFDYHLFRLVVVAVDIVSSVIGKVVRQGDRSVYVEFRVEQSAGACRVIVAYAEMRSVVVRETLFHHEIFECGFRIFYGEFLVFEFHEYGERLLFADCREVLQVVRTACAACLLYR